MTQLAQIQALDLTSSVIGTGTAINWDEFRGEAGREHYKLLAWLASKFTDADIFDIGTHRGASAVALAAGGSTNRIWSFDLEHKYPLPTLPNVTWSLDNLMTAEGQATWRDRLLGSAFIFLDIDPHEGTRELEFIGWLRTAGYKGFVVCDDIWYFKEMRDNFWYQIPAAEKVDVTELGHWSGTGIWRTEPSKLWPAMPPTASSWTVVTAYFDLTAMPDASISIKARPAEHYLAAARSTMALEQNLVVFCEPSSEAALRAMRPAWLLPRTRFVTMSFEDFPLTKYRAKIQQNRREKPYAFDDRNTASYYLLCMARYAMLKQVMAENPFQSTHFAWLNICIERMGWRNVAALPGLWHGGLLRDAVSTCWIDYQPKELVENWPEYFKWGRCGMCSGFFTGGEDAMKEFCDGMEAAFLETLEAGYGHADEQLFSIVYWRQPGLFEHYYGDYQEMITNYWKPCDRPFEPVRLLATHAAGAGDWETCARACDAVWRAWKKGVAALDDGQLRELVRLYRDVRRRTGVGAELP